MVARDVCNSKHALAEEHTWGKSDEEGEEDDDVTRTSISPAAPGETLN